MEKKGNCFSITRINESNLLIEYNPYDFYLYDLENLQIVNNYQFDRKLNNVSISDNYFIIIIKNDKGVKKEVKVQNMFNSKFKNINNNIDFGKLNHIEFIFLSNDLLCYCLKGLIYLKNNDAK